MTICRPCRSSTPRFFKRRIAHDDRGVAAVEFALLLPLMLLIYLGTAEVSQALMATRKATDVAESLSDLVAEQEADAPLTDAEIADVFAAATAIMSPFPAVPLKMTVSSVTFSKSPKASTGFDAEPQWTITSNGGTPRPCQTLTPVADNSTPSPTTLPLGIYPTHGSAAASVSAIIADVVYTYTPTFGESLLAWSSTAGSMTFKHTTYMRPRNQSCVAYSGSTGIICTSNPTPCPSS